jgi:hypothetical protein
MYEAKVKQYCSNRNAHNVAIFGTSRMAVGLEPHIFDSCINSNGKLGLSTYNFSSFGTWNQENYYLFKKFLQDSNLNRNTRYVIMEFQNVMSVSWKRLSSDKVIYYQNLENLKFAWNYSRSTGSIYKIMGYVPAFVFAFLENLLNLGSSDILVKAKGISHSFNYYGYTNIKDEEQLKEIINPLEYSKSYLDCMKTATEKANNIFYGQIVELDSLATRNGIKLIWILPPVHVTKDMLAVYNAIPEDKKMNFNQSVRYPALFESGNWYDRTHFNAKGSKLFSEYIAMEFVKHLP